MRCLISGGAGFVGSHLCERLLNEGHEVICLDNFFTGSKRNINHLLNNRNFELVRHDVTVPYIVECDEIYNLACPASPITYQKNPVQTIDTSLMGAINMIKLAVRNKARILQTSTSEVYGTPLEHPQKESYWGNVNPIGIRSCYDESKRCVETIFMDYHRQYGVDIRIVRIFNTYGPGMAQDDGRVISNFIVQALRDEEITIYGDGKQTRSFQYIDDLIEGMILVMRSGSHSPINIGNPNEYTIIELANSIIEMTGSKSQIKYVKLPEDDPTRRQPDITKIKKLGWEPRVSISEGLRRTIDYFKILLNKRVYLTVDNPFKDDTV